MFLSKVYILVKQNMQKEMHGIPQGGYLLLFKKMWIITVDALHKNLKHDLNNTSPFYSFIRRNVIFCVG